MILLKQNRWPPEIYSNYTALLKRDYLLTVQQHYNLDISFLFKLSYYPLYCNLHMFFQNVLVLV